MYFLYSVCRKASFFVSCLLSGASASVDHAAQNAGPFATFTEWSSGADERAYENL